MNALHGAVPITKGANTNMRTARHLACIILILSLAVVSHAQAPAPQQSATKQASPVPALPADIPASATKYAYLLAGNRAGNFAMLTSANVLQTFLEYNDRGRGPQLRTRIVLSSTSVPREIEVTGHDYLKGPVSEHFSYDAGTASWKNKGEQGEKPAPPNAFYSRFSESPEEAALVIRAALNTPDHKLPLLPAGEAQVERVGDQQVQAGGKSLTVTEYDVTGFGFSPYPVWLDPDKQLFASGSEWSTVIREGWEPVWPTLLKAQNSAQAARNAKLAKELAQKPTGQLVFQHANLFDSESATVQPGMTVVIKDNRIKSVLPDNALKNVPAGAQIIDATGKTLLPGLWDMHVHLSEDDGLLNIAAGVTTVRDLANDIDKLMAMRKSFDTGEAIGPRVVMAGFIDGPGPYQGPTKILADTPEQARRFVDRYKMLGYEQIKIYSSLKPELVPVIIDEAHKNGLRVSGHIPAFMSATQAVQDGYDEIQHINFIFLNFWFDRVKDTRTPARFTEVAQHAAELDLKSQPVQNFIALLKERHVDIDPTVGIFEGMFLARPGSVDPQFAEVADRMPPQVRRGFLGGGLPVPDGMDQRYRDSAQALLNMVNLLYTSGVPIVAGTDSLAGFALHSELEYYVKAGIPAPKVLQIATLGAARIMKHDGQSGSIAPGKLADVILIDGDPTTRISDIRRVKTVVKDGVVYDSTAVYKAMGVAPY